MTFGVTPDHPATGYGYIRMGEALGAGLRRIAAFKEKPDRSVAERYLAEGDHLWNAGLFLFDPATLLDVFAEAGAAALRDAALDALGAASRSGPEIRLGADFAAVPAAAFDVAVMERTARGAVAAFDVGWTDVGLWSEIARLETADAPDGNASRGRVALLGCEGVYARAEGVTIAAAGVADLVIVATPQAVLVIPKERAEDVKKLFEAVHEMKP